MMRARNFHVLLVLCLLAACRTTPKKARAGLLFGNRANATVHENNDASAKSNFARRRGLPWPVLGDISSPFGRRWGRMHEGIDIRASKGTPILAPAPGKVIFAARRGDYGKLIIVDHGKYRTAYGHCDDMHVDKGDRVEKGDVIGTVGDTGNANGYHLHFEVRNQRDRALEPTQFLQPVAAYSSL